MRNNMVFLLLLCVVAAACAGMFFMIFKNKTYEGASRSERGYIQLESKHEARLHDRERLLLVLKATSSLCTTLEKQLC